jgi:hypothetical protein
MKSTRRYVTVDPTTRSIEVQNLTEREMFDWVLKGQAETRLIENYTHDGIFTFWIDEECRLDLTNELWLVRHLPQRDGFIPFTMLAGRAAITVSCVDNYPEPCEAFAKHGLTSERLVGLLCHWIPERMKKAAGMVNERTLAPIVTFNEEEMKEAIAKRREMDAEIAMLAVSCERACTMNGEQQQFLNRVAMGQEAA